jgi:site-specific DNA recombinase
MTRHVASPNSGGEDEAVLYLRVSTKEQATRGGQAEGFSIPAQRDAGQRKAASLDAAVIREFIEPGESAKTTDREALQEMLAYLTEHPVKYVIVHKLDRLARNRLDDVQLHLAIRQTGATLASCMENIDETPSGMLLHGILGSINEFYSANLATEVVKGMQQKVQTGGTPSLAPIGYLNVRHIVSGVEVRTVELDPKRAPLIRWAFTTYATGEWSLRQLATELEIRGLTQRPTAKRIARPLTAKELGKVLHNPYYTGTVTWKGVEFEGKHERLAEPDIYARVQNIIEAHRQSGERSYRRRHYLAGTLYCGHCNSKLIFGISTGRRGDRYAYWFCHGRHSFKNGCNLPYLPEERIEALVLRQWRREHLTEQQATSIRDGLLADLHDHTKAATERRAQVESRIDVIQRERRKWAEKAMSGAVPDDIARDEQARLGKQLLTAQETLATLRITDDQHGEAIHAATALLPTCGEAYRRGDHQLRREYNQAWFSAIYISCDDGEPHISHVERTEPIEALRNAEVHLEPQLVSMIERALAEEPTPERKGHGSLRYRVLTRLSGISYVEGSNLSLLVELRGFEPLTPSMRTRCATGLRHSPSTGAILPGKPRRNRRSGYQDESVSSPGAARPRPAPRCTARSGRSCPDSAARCRRRRCAPPCRAAARSARARP